MSAKDAELRELRQEIARLNGLLAASRVPDQGWQPIETAPKDELVLVHDAGYVGKGIQEQDGRWLDTECGRADAYFDPPPTHWRPLPAPPSEPPNTET